MTLRTLEQCDGKQRLQILEAVKHIPVYWDLHLQPYNVPIESYSVHWPSSHPIPVNLRDYYVSFRKDYVDFRGDIYEAVIANDEIVVATYKLPPGQWPKAPMTLKPKETNMGVDTRAVFEEEVEVSYPYLGIAGDESIGYKIVRFTDEGTGVCLVDTTGDEEDTSGEQKTWDEDQFEWFNGVVEMRNDDVEDEDDEEVAITLEDLAEALAGRPPLGD